ncbi:hypothetical protein N9901_01220 [Flavobacteriaceae bacterium]|nr:hypothetical protein [Flavobacteriaceae bacterium]
MKYIKQFLIFFLLTIITQIGGIIYLLSIWVSEKWNKNFRFKKGTTFIVLYLITTFGIIPSLAKLNGREKVIHTDKIKPTNFMTVVLNRNYVRPELNKLLAETDQKLSNSNFELRYLDANFPFINNFPLLPHLSHKDGKKIDLSLVYETENGKITNSKKSMSGYGVFENPTEKEFNQIEKCKTLGYFQYDYPKYLTLGKINNELNFSDKGNTELIKALLKNEKLGKLFIEPHLKQRLNLSHNKIRYHGCRAVRHDDHIHIQLK